MHIISAIIYFFALILLLLLIPFIELMEFKKHLQKYNERNQEYCIPIPTKLKDLYSLRKSIDTFILDSRLLHYHLEQNRYLDDF